jgi:hypothetical protein
MNTKRWVLFDEANSPNPVDPNSEGWFITDFANQAMVFIAPNYRAGLLDIEYSENATHLIVHGATELVDSEVVVKSSNSFIESSSQEPWDLSGKSLQFSVQFNDDVTTLRTYTTNFQLPTNTAQQVCDQIIAQNPDITDAVYDSDGHVRIGVYPAPGGILKLTVVGGSAIYDMGFIEGQSIEIVGDMLNNPNIVTPVTITDSNGNVYTEGIEFLTVAETGEILWEASTAIQQMPEQGSLLTVSYSYIMKREIEHLLDLVSNINAPIEMEYL